VKKLFFLICIIFFLSGCTQPHKGKIIKVIDGDTYVFKTGGDTLIIRMQGIDAPENKQPYSKESTGFLKKYLNKEAFTRISGTDRYGRSLGTLFVDGQNVNLRSIEGGFSWHFKRYSLNISYAVAEYHARKDR